MAEVVNIILRKPLVFNWRSPKLLIAVLTVSLFVVVLVSGGKGAMEIEPLQILSIFMKRAGFQPLVAFEEGQENVFWLIRLPRVLLGVLIGMGLAVSGVVMQGLFRNPLADPGLIGITSGASFFAALVIVFISGFSFYQNLTGVGSYYALSFITFIGASLTSIFVYRLSTVGGRTIMATMLLSGIAANALFGSLTGLLTYVSTETQLRTLTFWALGSLGGASWDTVTAVLPFILLPVFILPGLARSLNAFALGESEAAYLGVNVGRLKMIIIILATLAVGASVAVAGAIAFVGLVVPHVINLIIGPDNRYLIPASALAGAVLLTLADLISRTIVAPAELPIGIVTALIGTPVFIWRLRKSQLLNLK